MLLVYNFPSICRRLLATIPGIVIACDGLYKGNLFCKTTIASNDHTTHLVGLHDPYATLALDGKQFRTTFVIKKTVDPYWDVRFHL